jgi:hypothetical protein
MTYDTGYPKERIGGRNPYHRCAYCKVSDPQINGELENHADWCEYKQRKLLEQKVELLKLDYQAERKRVVKNNIKYT